MARKLGKAPVALDTEADISPRMLAFVELWMQTGNGARSAEGAGYRGSIVALSVQANRLLKHAKVRAAIRTRRLAMERAGVTMSREERQAWWSGVVKDPTAKLRDRIRASEVLGKAQGDFVDKVELEENVHVHVSWDDGPEEQDVEAESAALRPTTREAAAPVARRPRAAKRR